MTRWRRPYRERDRLLRPVVTVVASAVLIWAVLFAVVLQPAISAWWWPPLAIGLTIAVVVLQFRVNAQSVAVGERGIRIRTAFRVRVVPWAAVRRVAVQDDPRYRNQALVIETRDGERIRTPIFRDGQRPFRSTGPLGHVALFGSDLDALAQTLDGMAREQNS